AALAIFDAGGTLAFEEDAGGERPGLDREIGAPFRPPQISARRRHAEAIFGGELVKSGPFDALAIEIAIVAKARFDAGLDIDVAERVRGFGDIGAMGGTMRAGEPLLAKRVALHA